MFAVTFLVLLILKVLGLAQPALSWPIVFLPIMIGFAFYIVLGIIAAAIER